MNHFPTVWIENSPDSLLDIALRNCIRNKSIFTEVNTRKEEFRLMDDLSLPVGVCERMLSISQRELSHESFNKIACCFKDVTNTRLSRLDVNGSAIENEVLEILTRHSIVELDISNCRKLDMYCLSYIDRLRNSLVSLKMGDSFLLFTPVEHYQKVEKSDDLPLLLFPSLENRIEPSPDSTEDSKLIVQLCFPLLRKLVINELSAYHCNYIRPVVNSTKCMTHLDLSGCLLDCGDIENLLSQKQLTSLILCDVFCVVQSVPALCQIKSLRHLDISQTPENKVHYENPLKNLKLIVDSLENLVSLDISGTNLDERRIGERESPESGLSNDGENFTDIPAFASRVNRPFEFLGLFDTFHDACHSRYIPAERIAGDATEDQLLTAGQVYCGREDVIERILDNLVEIFHLSTCQNTRLALDVIIEAMRLHRRKKNIEGLGIASLYYILKGETQELFNPKMRQKIMKILVDALVYYHADSSMARNTCVALMQFKIPEDMSFDYEELVRTLLIIVAPDKGQKEILQRVGLYVLVNLACQLDVFNKKLIGDDLGAISVILQIIEERLRNNLFDEVMEIAWGLMWDLTDDTPINCARFLEGRGMDFFLRCLQAGPEVPELRKFMFGMLGNVAEVKDLRPQLMKDEYLSVFSEFLKNKSDGIELSYHAAGILSHIASDGEEEWCKHNISEFRRKEILANVVETIGKWDLDANRSISYRSLKPILRLLNVEYTPDVQYWAVWALANLTRVHPENYCFLLKKEGGIDTLKRLLMKKNCSRNLELAGTIIRQCERFENGEIEDSEFCDM